MATIIHPADQSAKIAALEWPSAIRKRYYDMTYLALAEATGLRVGTGRRESTQS